MQFTRLRVLGFKSFVEPTEFQIEPGLTGVVGPNGCGKSNLVEALRWVMGESSYKNMRASGMDDVIFSGTGGRPARNTAEVSLTADNATHTAPSALNDADVLEITRRIEREAGSVYRINGREVRARDVQLLFADASTGAHSPSIVGQGRIGELIAAKPTDRRQLLEEAAGISGLYNRRHEAELRLNAAETNLDRLDDVIGEIEVQLETLKRQARQAVRYRNLSGDIRRAEATAMHLRWTDAGQALAEAETALGESVASVGIAASGQAETARIQAEAAAVLPALRDDAASAAAAAQRIGLAQEQLDAEEVRIQERLETLERHLGELAGDIDRERRMVAENASVLARLDTEERDLEVADAAHAERLESAARRRQTAAGELERSEEALAGLTARHAELTAGRAQIGRAIADAERRVVRLDQDIAALERRIAGLGVADDVRDRLSGLEADADAGARAAAAAETAAEDAEAALGNAREKADSARNAAIEGEQRIGRIETEMSTLARMLESDRREGEAPLIDAVEVEAGFEAALGAAFGDDLDAPADETAPTHWRAIDAGVLQPLPGGAQPLAYRVTAPPVLKQRLSQIGIVDRAEGADLQQWLRPGQRLVSREGDLWRWDGYVAAEAAQAAAQRLASRNRLAELEAEIGPARLEAAERGVVRESAVAALQRAQTADREAREALRRARQAGDAARNAFVTADREASAALAQHQALTESLGRLAADRNEAAEALESARAALADAADPDSLSDDLAAARNKVGEDRSALAEARAAAETLSREAEMRSSRLAAIAVERQDWRERGRNAEMQIATLTERRDEAVAERGVLSEEPGRIEEKRRGLMSEAATADRCKQEASDRLAEGEAALKEADAAARGALDRLSAAREQRGRTEERTTAARSRLDEIARQIGEAFDCRPEDVADIAALKPDRPLPALADTEARLERYRRERERLGAVNLRADEEAQEVGERREALVSERDDLVEAIKRLRHGIGSLNREGRERLLASFETVDGHFRNLFTHLFGGGEAELRLTESDDPLEAGLEIVARPPGKKPQIMTLLSGGEQALTALSLIFAVFLTNPAPICVLDEVDAPLDDANVERFCDLLDEMTRQTDTRFVVITHHPITMARMNRLLGVTMAERGVSQLVSVDLETAETFREAG